jgi:hypothetical protein
LSIQVSDLKAAESQGNAKLQDLLRQSDVLKIEKELAAQVFQLAKQSQDDDPYGMAPGVRLLQELRRADAAKMSRLSQLALDSEKFRVLPENNSNIRPQPMSMPVEKVMFLQLPAQNSPYHFFEKPVQLAAIKGPEHHAQLKTLSGKEEFSTVRELSSSSQPYVLGGVRVTPPGGTDGQGDRGLQQSWSQNQGQLVMTEASRQGNPLALQDQKRTYQPSYFDLPAQQAPKSSFTQLDGRSVSKDILSSQKQPVFNDDVLARIKAMASSGNQQDKDKALEELLRYREIKQRELYKLNLQHEKLTLQLTRAQAQGNEDKIKKISEKLFAVEQEQAHVTQQLALIEEIHVISHQQEIERYLDQAESIQENMEEQEKVREKKEEEEKELEEQQRLLETGRRRKLERTKQYRQEVEQEKQATLEAKRAQREQVEREEAERVQRQEERKQELAQQLKAITDKIHEIDSLQSRLNGEMFRTFMKSLNVKYSNHFSQLDTRVRNEMYTLVRSEYDQMVGQYNHYGQTGFALWMQRIPLYMEYAFPSA